jgi:peptide/nickel transport system ATP-binding protein
MIYQDPFESLDPGQTVFSTLSAPLRNLVGLRDSGEIRRRVSDLLLEMDLVPDEVMHRFPHELSGGQRQRVNIARALAAGPKLLIADEPITMLDAAQRLKILALLKRLQKKRNLSILLITHDLASAKVMSERTLVMYLGKIVESGPTREIMNRPNHPYVELILESTPRLDIVRRRMGKESRGGGGRGEPAPASTMQAVGAFRRNLRGEEEGGSDKAQGEEDLHLTWIEQSEKVRSGCVFEPRCKYAMEICRTKQPDLAQQKFSSEGHLAACYNPLNSFPISEVEAGAASSSSPSG